MLRKFVFKKIKFHKGLIKKAECKCDNCGKIYLRDKRLKKNTKTFCKMSCKREYFKDCLVEGCNRHALSLHYCNVHYENKRRYGIAEGPKCQVCNNRSVNNESIRNTKNRQKMKRIFKGIMCSKCYFYILRRYVLFLLGEACSCCNEKEIRFLAIDHKFGGGSKERKSTGEKYLYYERMVKNLNKYQILCHNCNIGKELNKGICPHHK
jgi:hypothetical protein|tara:strand:+ start:256 stop:879 length:624 start_codon:yes stop_codon:yes gene_type:complete